MKIAGGGVDGEGVRVGVKTLSDDTNVVVSRGGTVKVIGPYVGPRSVERPDRVASVKGHFLSGLLPDQLVGPLRFHRTLEADQRGEGTAR